MSSLFKKQSYYPKINLHKSSSSPNNNRIYYFDNLKFFLVFLVVTGHFIIPMSHESHFLSSVFLFIYLFHMPLFIFTTGYFSKSAFDENGIKLNKLCSLAIIYFLFKFLIFFIKRMIFGLSNVNFSLLVETDVPWYMLAMIIWICIIPLIYNLKPLPILSITIIIGILVGYDSNIGDFLSLARVFVFAPFFYAGYFVDKTSLQNLLNKKFKLASLIFIFILFGFIYLNEETLYPLRVLLTGRNQYSSLNTPMLGPIYRLIYYFVSTATCISVIMIIPRAKTFFSKLGERTLQPYFLHYIVFLFYLNCNWYIKLLAISEYWKIGIILLSFILTIILSTKPFGTLFVLINKIKVDKLYNPEKTTIKKE